MPSPFTPAQLAIVDRAYADYMNWNDPSQPVDKNETRHVTLECWAVGPRFHPTAVDTSPTATAPPPTARAPPVKHPSSSPSSAPASPPTHTHHQAKASCLRIRQG